MPKMSNMRGSWMKRMANSELRMALELFATRYSPFAASPRIRTRACPSSALLMRKSGRPDLRGERPKALHRDQRAMAVLERPERLVGRNGGQQLVEVARILRFRRRLHLEQIGRVDLAAVGADRALAEQGVVGRQLLHLGHHRGAVRRTLQRIY